MKKKNLIILFLLMASVSISQTLPDKIENENSIDKLRWLSGYWTAEIGGTKMEEFWLPAKNGSMVGIHRDSFQSGNVFYEYLRIEQRDESIIYYASPKGKSPTEFKLIFLKNNRVIFENPEHDFPQRILYSLKADTLVARIEGNVKGIFKFSEWQWIKSKLPE